jgi:hypothetical protein
MYFSFDKDKVSFDYPIFTSDVDCIVHFFSLDLVKINHFDYSLYALFPETLVNLVNLTFEDKISSGVILPYRKSNPIIIHIPICDTHKDGLNPDYLHKGIMKLSSVLNEIDAFSFIKKIGIQKDCIDSDILTDILNKFDLPEIKFY